MSYSAKTNWQLNEIVEPADMNRIEQGIKDLDNATADYVKKDGSVAMEDLTVGTRAAGQDTGVNSGSVGTDIQSSGANSFASGSGSKATITNARAQGEGTLASGINSDASGKNNTASGPNSTTEGEGTYTGTSATNSHAGGFHGTVTGLNGFSHGNYTVSGGTNATAFGDTTEANAVDSFAVGKGTKANGAEQFVTGRYNEVDANALIIVGKGTSDVARANALKLDNTGKLEVAGDMVTGSGYSMNSLYSNTNQRTTSIGNATSFLTFAIAFPKHKLEYQTAYNWADYPSELITVGKGQLITEYGTVLFYPETSNKILIRKWSGSSWLTDWSDISSSAEVINTNELVNGDLQIWEGGTSFTLSSVVTVPVATNWTTTVPQIASGSLVVSRNTTQAETDTSYCMELDCTALVSTDVVFANQLLESNYATKMQGKAVTFSVYIKATTTGTYSIQIEDGTNSTGFPSVSTTNASQSCSVTTEWQRFSVTHTVQSGANSLVVRVYSPSTYTGKFYVSRAKLEKESTATDFVSRSYEEELVLCKSNAINGTQLLDNGGFDFWQRGTSFSLTTQSNKYCADRWFATLNQVTSGTFVVNANTAAKSVDMTYCAELNCTSLVTTSNVNLTQYFESMNIRPLRNKQITFSVYLKVNSGTATCGLVTWDGTDTDTAPSTNTTNSSKNIVVTTEWQRFTVTHTVQNLASSLGVRVGSPVGFSGILYVGNAKLEEGIVPTQFYHRNVEEEFSRCRRYHISGGTHANQNIAHYCNNGGLTLMIPVTMRTTPTVINHTSGLPQINNDSSTWVTVASYNTLMLQESCVIVMYNPPTGVTIGRSYLITRMPSLDCEIY